LRSRLQQQILVGALLAAFLMAARPTLAAPADWDDVSVTLHGVGSSEGAILIVRGKLHSSVRLPTVAELPVPAGAKLNWVGEVRGSNPMSDTQASFDSRPAGECDLLSITTQHSRLVQAEMEPPAGWLVVDPDGTIVAMKWTASKPVDHVRLSFEVVGDLHAERLRPRAATVARTGDETVYAIDDDSVDTGDVLTLSALVAQGAETATATPRQAASGSGSDLAGAPHKTAPVVFAFAALLAAALVVVLVFAFRRRGAAQTEPRDEQT